MLFRQIVTLLRQRDIDDALAALVLVENNLLIVRSAFDFPSEHVGYLHDFVPANNASLHRPIDIALLRIDRLRLRQRDNKVTALERAVVDLPARLIEGNSGQCGST